MDLSVSGTASKPMRRERSEQGQEEGGGPGGREDWGMSDPARLCQTAVRALPLTLSGWRGTEGLYTEQ